MQILSEPARPNVERHGVDGRTDDLKDIARTDEHEQLTGKPLIGVNRKGACIEMGDKNYGRRIDELADHG